MQLTLHTLTPGATAGTACLPDTSVPRSLPCTDWKGDKLFPKEPLLLKDRALKSQP